MSEFILPARKHPAGVPDTVDSVRHHLCQFLAGLDGSKEWVVTIERQSKKRSAAQNRLQQKWHMEAAQQLKDETAEEKRAFCKLHFGVPILRAEDEKFKAEYDRVIRPMPYETKLSLMRVPFDFPTTRLMSVEQKTRYLDAVWNHYSSQGVRLTAPADAGL